MTDGQNKPVEDPDDDWAMSEPEPELKGEELEITSPPEDLDGKVSSLYDPLQTDELEGWDISTAELNKPVSHESPLAFEEEPSEPEEIQPVLEKPQNFIEIIKPEKQSVQQESWEMKPAAQDGWQMPKPEFRCSEGISARDLANISSAQSAAPVKIDENLSDIYSPPDTEEVFEEASEESEETDSVDEVFDSVEFDEELQIDDEDIEEQAVVAYQEQSLGSPETKEKSKGKTFLFLGVGFILVLFVVVAISAVAYFFYFR